MDNCLGIAVFDRHTILVNQLRLACLLIEHRHANERGPTAALLIRHKRLGNFLLREMRGKERVVDHTRGGAERFGLVANIPTIHCQSMAAAAVVLLCHYEPLLAGRLARRWLVDELGSGRLRHQSQYKCHHGFALLVVKRKLRHPVAFVVAFIFRLFVVVAARSPQLLPKKSFSVVG